MTRYSFPRWAIGVACGSVLLAGCAGPATSMEQTAGDNATLRNENAALKLELGKLEATVKARDVSLMKAEAKIGETKQEGLINVSVPSAGSLGPWLAVVVVSLVGGKLWLAKRKALYGMKHMKRAIEESAQEHHDVSPARAIVDRLKDRVAKYQANEYGGIGMT